MKDLGAISNQLRSQAAQSYQTGKGEKADCDGPCSWSVTELPPLLKVSVPPACPSRMKPTPAKVPCT